MTDEQRFDYDLVPHMVKGFGEALGGIIPSAGESALGLGLRYALRAAGYESDDEKTVREIRDSLARIEQTLDVMDHKLDGLTDDLEKLTRQVLSGRIWNEYADSYQSFSEARGRIGAAVDELDTALRFLRSEDPRPDKLRSNLESLKDHYPKVAESVTNVARAFGSEPSLPVRVLIESWTDYQIAKLEGTDAVSEQLPAMSDAVETQFLEGLSALFLGYGFLINLRAADDLIRKAYPDYSSPFVTSSNSSLEDARTTLEKWRTRHLVPIADGYRTCVLRLLSSCYRPELPANRPTFLEPDLLDETETRMELTAALLAVPSLKPTAPGISVRRHTRPSVVRRGVRFAPRGYGAEDGAVRPVAAKYRGDLLPHWYKCVDFLDASTLEAFERSDLQIVEQSWAVDALPSDPWAPIEGDGLARPIRPSLYDRKTLKPVVEGEPDDPSLVWFGHTTDASDLTARLAWQERKWQFEESGFGTRLFENVEVKRSVDPPPWASFDMTIVSDTDARTRNADLDLYHEVAYPRGAGSGRCLLLASSRYAAAVGNWKRFSQGQPTYVKVYLRLLYLEEGDRRTELFYRKLGSGESVETRQMDLYGPDNTGTDRPKTSDDRPTLDLAPGARVRLLWRSRLAFDSNHDPSSTGAIVQANARQDVDWVRLAWRQPKFGG